MIAPILIATSFLLAPESPAGRTAVPLARPAPRFRAADLGRSEPDMPMERVILLLRRRPGKDAEFRSLLDDLQNPSSPRFHRWLTPDEYASRFGASDQDVDALREWMNGERLNIESVSRSRFAVTFSARVADIDRAFATEIHDFNDAGVLRRGEVSPISLPERIAPLVAGVVSLNSFPLAPAVRTTPARSPNFNRTNGSHALAPADFAKIYGLSTLLASGVDGHQTGIAIVGISDIAIDDVRFFRSYFGLPAGDPAIVHNGPAPGQTHDGNEYESDLDVEWAGAAAPKAAITLVSSASTQATSGIDLSLLYAVDNFVAPIISISYLACEAALPSGLSQFYDLISGYAAAYGTTIIACSGDSGPAGCDDPSSPVAFGGASVSRICSPPQITCVGGTLFDDAKSPASYWNAAVDPVTKASALSYIPEVAWNESGTAAGGADLNASAGGPSSLYAKPTWQSAPGVRADGRRDVPDLAFSAAAHDGYLIVSGHTGANDGFLLASGTSAGTPSFAGILALVEQQNGIRQGNINPTLYRLGSAQYNGTGAAVFHDVVSGSSSVPGLEGYPATAGYDLVTGLGSVDASALVTAWPTGHSPLPNLRFYKPNGWPSGFIITNDNTKTSDTLPLTTTDNVIVAFALSNNGDAAVEKTYKSTVALDGSPFSTASMNAPPQGPGYYFAWFNPLGFLKVGAHHVTVTADSGNAVVESDKGDNVAARDFAVYPAGKVPNLALATPHGWAAPFVLSTRTGATASDSPLPADAGLYLSFGIANLGTAPTYVGFDTSAEIDFNPYGGLPLQRDASSLEPSALFVVRDLPVGALSAGSHTLNIQIDPANALAESSKADNELSTPIEVEVVRPIRAASGVAPITVARSGGRK